MDITALVERLDSAYYQTFTKEIQTSWGYLYINEDQPTYYDANHAYIRLVPSEPDKIITKVIHFYQSKHLIPRFYIYNVEQQTKLISALKERGFGYEELVHPVQLWNGSLSLGRNDPRITIELVTDDNFQEAMNIECSIKEFGGQGVREKAFKAEYEHPAFTYYLLRLNGVACSTACFFIEGNHARLESVATLKEFRGQGLIGQLIYFLQHEVKKRNIEYFWVFPITEQVEKVYSHYGFQTLDTLRAGHAFLGGKSVQEIRES